MKGKDNLKYNCPLYRTKIKAVSVTNVKPGLSMNLLPINNFTCLKRKQFRNYLENLSQLNKITISTLSASKTQS